MRRLFANADVKEPGTKFKDTEGNTAWELGNKRRLTLSAFKGKQYVNIREYYEKDGKVTNLYA